MAAIRVSKNGGGALARHGRRRIPRVPGETYLQRKGLKTTQQREAIVDAFLRTSGHVALEDLLSQARRKHPGVGLATVYRTVKLLEEAGHRGGAALRAGPDAVRDRGGAGAPRPPDLRAAAASSGVRERRDRGAAGRGRAPLGFNVLRHRHELFGLCEKARGARRRALPGRGQRPSRALLIGPGEIAAN